MSLAAGGRKKRVCFIPTATGDSPSAIDAVSEAFADAVSEAFAGRADVDFSVLTLFTQPSVPDTGAHLMAQDVLLAGGGSVVNRMAVWRAPGPAPVMRERWESGVVLAGWSAGSLCWHRGGPAGSFGDSLAVFTDGLGLLPCSNRIRDPPGDQPRRLSRRPDPAAQALTARGSQSAARRGPPLVPSLFNSSLLEIRGDFNNVVMARK